MDVEDEDGISLSEIYTGKNIPRIVYEYDFGDSWQHEILLEKILEPEPNVTYPRCIEGARHVHRRTWVASGAMPSSWKQSVTQIMRITMKCWNGSVASSTRKSSP